MATPPPSPPPPPSHPLSLFDTASPSDYFDSVISDYNQKFQENQGKESPEVKNLKNLEDSLTHGNNTFDGEHAEWDFHVDESLQNTEEISVADYDEEGHIFKHQNEDTTVVSQDDTNLVEENNISTVTMGSHEVNPSDNEDDAWEWDWDSVFLEDDAEDIWVEDYDEEDHIVSEDVVISATSISAATIGSHEVNQPLENLAQSAVDPVPKKERRCWTKDEQQ